MVLVWMSFRTIFLKSSAKENTRLGVLVTSGHLGSNSVKKEGGFICRIGFEEYHDE
jgi:hypothetical protein